MNDKRQIRSEIITYLCGDENLSREFISLLKAGNLSEDDGKIIRGKMLDEMDTNHNLDLMFKECYRKQLADSDDYPLEAMDKYTGDRQYRKLLDQHFPQSVKESSDIIINMLDEDDILKIKQTDKFLFGVRQHFGIGLFMRNQFGINQHLSPTLMGDICTRSGKMFFMSDNVSGYLLDELWEEIQRRY